MENLTRPEAQPDSAQPEVSRRDFLSLAWKSLLGVSAMLGLGGLARFMSYQPDPSPPTVFDLGPAENYPLGARTLIPEARAVLLHTEQGFQAMSLVCPHLGCVADLAEAGFACPCHGSRFDLQGGVQRGPADRPLRSLKIETDSAGHLILDISEG